jgi:hypothetical protein
MGKRSSFERIPRDFYPTPYQAVVPLLPHLLPGTRFAEPCAGDGALIDHLSSAGHICVDAFDIEPQRADVARDDATMARVANTDFYITNPPWDRAVLHPIILNLSRHKPTWLLFDADWIHTRQSAPFLGALKAIVSVGRVKWIPDSKMTGKDNCCWYLFNADPQFALDYPTVFYGRAA